MQSSLIIEKNSGKTGEVCLSKVFLFQYFGSWAGLVGWLGSYLSFKSSARFEMKIRGSCPALGFTAFTLRLCRAFPRVEMENKLTRKRNYFKMHNCISHNIYATCFVYVQCISLLKFDTAS